MKIGFIGQGFIGKNYANDFENRGYSVVRYALESEYSENRDLISACDIVFIAVPTPTTPGGFKYDIVDDVLSLVGDEKIAVIKSTLVPGSTDKLRQKHPEKTILFSPEFLCEATAAKDAAHPLFNIVGVDSSVPKQIEAAKLVHSILPNCEHNFTLDTKAAELFKNIHNIHGYMRVVSSNLFFDLAESIGVTWSEVSSVMNIDPMMSPYYNEPVHKNGRGAGGNCFIKDMAAFRSLYEELLSGDSKGISLLKALEDKNLEILAATNKSQDLVLNVYGNKK